MKAFFTNVIHWIKNKASAIWNGIKKFGTWLKERFQAMSKKAKTYAVIVWGKMKSAGAWIKSKIRVLFSKIKGIFVKKNPQVVIKEPKPNGKAHATPKQNKAKNSNKKAAKMHFEDIRATA